MLETNTILYSFTGVLADSYNSKRLPCGPLHSLCGPAGLPPHPVHAGRLSSLGVLRGPFLPRSLLRFGSAVLSYECCYQSCCWWHLAGKFLVLSPQFWCEKGGYFQVVFVIFLAYAMMPLKSWVAGVFGFLLCSGHVAVSSVFATDFPHLRWQQVGIRLIFPHSLLPTQFFCS